MRKPSEFLVRFARGLFGAPCANESIDGSYQDFRLDGVDDIAIGARVESAYLVLGQDVGGRNMNDGDGGSVGITPQAAADFIAIHIREIYIEQHEKRPVQPSHFEGLFSR